MALNLADLDSHKVESGHIGVDTYSGEVVHDGHVMYDLAPDMLLHIEVGYHIEGLQSAGALQDAAVLGDKQDRAVLVLPWQPRVHFV